MRKHIHLVTQTLNIQARQLTHHNQQLNAIQMAYFQANLEEEE